MGVLKSTTGQGSWQETARGKLRALLQTGSALAVVLTLGACSSVPDAINPIEWGKSVGDMFDGEDEEVAVKSDEAIPGEDGEYPSLSDTPPKPVGDRRRRTRCTGCRPGSRSSERAIYPKWSPSKQPACECASGSTRSPGYAAGHQPGTDNPGQQQPDGRCW